jgi:CBS domain-containing protein
MNTPLSAPNQPANSLIAQLARDMMAFAPFAQMEEAHVRLFVQGSQQRYFGPDEQVIGPADGPVRELLFIRRGAISGIKGLAQLSGGSFLYETGDLFPISAVIAERPVTATYQAREDSFVLALPNAKVHTLAAQSPAFADFLNRRVQSFLDLSRKALQSQYASKVLAEQSMEAPLSDLVRSTPLSCQTSTPLRTALSLMKERRVGSILILHPDESAHGILTRHDVLDRITLPAVSLDVPIEQVMISPVHCLSDQHTAQDAALMMSRYGIRHVPITRAGKVIGIVSERDLFAMQRLSLQHLSSSLRQAPNLEALKALAPDIRKFAERLLGQGIAARQLTGLISHLNDLLTQRLLDLLAAQHGLDKSQACWLALGSEGRDEQTVATDQDNALVLQEGLSETQLKRWLALAREANDTLDACGYPLCEGNIMASNPELALSAMRWQERFANWIEFGTPEDLLNASIFFDLRPLWGEARLAQGLRQQITQSAAQAPRFLKMLALNALQRTAPLTWTGAIDTHEDGSVDLKLRGTAIFVDAARLYALAHSIPATNTRERLQAMGIALGAPQREYEGWIGAFEFLQMLRLRVQTDIAEGRGDPDHPNRIVVRTMNTIDRRILKESLRLMSELQQRMQLDYGR